MIKSMTGFGSASVTIGSTVLATEVRAVNSRFLDFKASLPKELNYLQDEIRRTVQDVCIRGWVTVTVNLEEAEASSNGSISFDRRRFEQYASILDIIEKEYECKIDLEKIIDLKELITTEPADQIDKDTVMKSRYSHEECEGGSRNIGSDESFGGGDSDARYEEKGRPADQYSG